MQLKIYVIALLLITCFISYAIIYSDVLYQLKNFTYFQNKIFNFVSTSTSASTSTQRNYGNCSKHKGSEATVRKAKSNSLECYKEIECTFPDVLDRKLGEKVVIFQETSCKAYEAGKIILEEMQACALESAALKNPDYEVHLLLLSTAAVGKSNDLNDRLVRAVLSYDNVFFSQVNLERYVQATPVERIFRTGLIEKSIHFVVHIADVMRFVSMWRYPATYMDLDVITLKSLNDLTENFAGFEHDYTLGSAIMKFGKGSGRDFADTCIHISNETFTPNTWAENSNGVLHKCLSKICKTNDASKWNEDKCQGFKVYPPSILFPTTWDQWSCFVDPKRIDETLRVLPQATVVHLWHHMFHEHMKNSNFTYGFGTNDTAIDIIFSRNCPKVHRELIKKA